VRRLSRVVAANLVAKAWRQKDRRWMMLAGGVIILRLVDRFVSSSKRKNI